MFKHKSNSFKDIEYLPTSAIQDGAPITFEIGKDERYTDASEFVIKTVVEIQGENSTALTGKQFTNAEAAGTLEKVGVINNLGHSLWEQIVLLINDTKVTESSNNYAYKAMLETLLSYDDVDEKSVLRLSCFKKDHGNVTADCPTATHANSFRIANSRKIFDINLAKISVCSPRSFISKKLLYFVWYIFICCRHLCDTKTTLSILFKHGFNFLIFKLFKKVIISWWIDNVRDRFTTGNFR